MRRRERMRGGEGKGERELDSLLMTIKLPQEQIFGGEEWRSPTGQGHVTVINIPIKIYNKNITKKYFNKNIQ